MSISQYVLKWQKKYLLESLFQYQGLVHMEHQASLSVPLFLSLVDLTQLSHLLKKTKEGKKKGKTLVILTNTWISQNREDLEH